MSLLMKRLVAHLLKHKFDFAFEWDRTGTTYYLHIILGNIDYLIDVDDHDLIKSLYHDIKTYWTN